MKNSTEKVEGQMTEDLVSQAEIFRISATRSHFKHWAPKRDNESKTLGRLTKYMKQKERKRNVKRDRVRDREREMFHKWNELKLRLQEWKENRKDISKRHFSFVFGNFLFFQIDLFSFLVLCSHWKSNSKERKLRSTNWPLSHHPVACIIPILLRV